MAKFSQNTLNQVAGFDGQIIAQELVYNQKDFWNFSWASDIQYTGGWVVSSTPINLTGATISAQVIRRGITNFRDSRTGLDFVIDDYPLVPEVAVVTSSSSSTNYFTCNDTSLLYLDKPIRFTGTVFGGVAINTTYFVKEIPTATEFSISATSGGSVLALSNATGTMTANTIDPSPINLSITNRDDSAGTFTMIIDDNAWALIAGDPDLDINAIDPACFTGRLKISFPAVGTQPEYDEVIFLLFLVASDGVINYG
jgi:hypothetical protein